MNLPNFISLGRLFAVPFIIWLVLTRKMELAFWVFVGAGISDILDGLLARLLKSRTKIGAYLDPLADKALLAGLFITLAVKDYIPLWLTILVVFRDVLIIAGSLLLLLLEKNFTVKPLVISKVNTLAQIILVTMVLGGFAMEFPYPNPFVDAMIYITGFTTFLSGLMYMGMWIKTINKEEQ